jgi:AAA15 family ATPase/GTPase
VLKMIKNIKIENFKSIQSLDLDLGRLNVFIGANGSGKTNILEAICLGSAVNENKADNIILVNRGIRLTEPRLMMPIFKLGNEKSQISVIVKQERGTDIIVVERKNSPTAQWGPVFMDKNGMVSLLD